MRLLALSALLLASSAFAQNPIRPGSAAVDGSRIVDSYGTYKVQLLQPMQQDIGTYTLTINVDQEAGTVTSTSYLMVPMANQMQSDSLVAAWPSLAPISHQSDNSERMVALTFDGMTVAGMKMPKMGGDPEMIDETTSAAFFDSAWMTEIARSLPFAEGYSAEIATFDAETSSMRNANVSVVGMEENAGPDGSSTIWKVRSTSGTMVSTYSVDADTREFLRMEFAPQPGVVVAITRQ